MTRPYKLPDNTPVFGTAGFLRGEFEGSTPLQDVWPDLWEKETLPQYCRGFYRDKPCTYLGEEGPYQIEILVDNEGPDFIHPEQFIRKWYPSEG